jgi:hypothetical protein
MEGADVASSSNVRGRKEAGAKRSPRAAAAPDAEPDDVAPPIALEPIPYTGVRNWLSLAIAAAAVWWVALIGMAIVSANPVTLNHAQLVQATHVVMGTVLDPEAGRVRVEQDWKFRSPGEITVENLAETGVRTGETYVLPLLALDGADRFAVVAPRLPGFDEDARGERVARFGPPQVYPATEEALDQLRSRFPPR